MWYFFKTFPALINSGTTQPLYIPCWVQRWYAIGSIQLDTVDHLLWIWKRLIWNYKFWSVYEPWGKGHKALRRLVSLMNELPTVHLTLKILNTCGIYNVDCSRLILHLQTQKDKYKKKKKKNWGKKNKNKKTSKTKSTAFKHSSSRHSLRSTKHMPCTIAGWCERMTIVSTFFWQGTGQIQA